MIRELQELDRELSRDKNVTVLRRDFQMFGHDFQKESAAFLRDVSKIATREKNNSVTIVVLMRT